MKLALAVKYFALSRLMTKVGTNAMVIPATTNTTTRSLCGGGRGSAQGRRGQGRGRGNWQQQQPVADDSAPTRMQGGGGSGCNCHDMATIHNLVDHRENIQRTVEKTDQGIKTHTWSDEKQVSDWIVEHVTAMKRRMEEDNRIRQRDPLFVATFDHAHLIDDFDLEVEEDGVKVTETSADPCTINILHSHSDVVTGFIDNGRYELRRNHPVPNSCAEGKEFAPSSVV